MPAQSPIVLQPHSVAIVIAYYTGIVAGLAAMRLPGGGWIAFATYYLLLPLGAVVCWRAAAGRWPGWGALPVRSHLQRAVLGVAAGGGVLAGITLLAHAADWLTVERLPALGTLLGLAAQQALVAAIEEGAFRGVIQRVLTARWGSTRGLWIAGALFGLFHLPNIAEQGVPGRLVPLTLLNLTVMGWVFGDAYRRAGNLALPFGLHLGWNVISYSVEDWSGTVFHAPQAWIGSPVWFPESGLLATVALLALAGMLMLTWRDGHMRAQPPAT